ncbi:MAG: hypothetical protein OJF52_001225 [Nitrospira sp.]|jgi:hypothetical protein|nr:MAG: hypothetical protein OJF52_001225 [Nitrospira sp.]
MKSTTDAFNSFLYLRSKLQKWKANDLRHPTADLSWEHVQVVATAHILPVKYLVESWPPAWATVTRHDKGGSNAIDHDEGTEHLAHCHTASPHHPQPAGDLTLC